MKKKYILLAAVLCTSMGLASCSDFLDEMPDQRTEVTPDNADYLLVGAYPTSMPLEIFEMYSDNTDAFPNRYSAMDRLQEDLYKWEDTSQNETADHYDLLSYLLDLSVSQLSLLIPLH